MRLFIAIPIPNSVKERLIQLEQPIRGLRWERRQKLHLTLKFLGETESERRQELQNSLRAIKFDVFNITLKGLGYFPENARPKVVWVGVEKNKALMTLQQEIEKECVKIGFTPESRSFKPHITIARSKGVSKRDVDSFVKHHKDFNIADVPVSNFVLYESVLKPKGSVHSRLETFELGHHN
jgi:2'-5' RNA ligase